MIQLRLLGSIELQDSDGREIEALISQPRRLAMLAYLALAHPNRRSRDSVIGLFWPDFDQARARRALRQALWFLRKELGEKAVVSRGGDLGIRERLVYCDAVAFQEMVAAARWNDALQLYRGDLLDGFFVTDATTEFEGWLDGERTRLRGLVRQAARALAKSETGHGDIAAAISAARRWLGLDPHNEEALRAVVALLDRSGDRAGAIRQYDEFALRLRGEYEVLPSPETIALVDSVRARSQLLASVAERALSGSTMSAPEVQRGMDRSPGRAPRSRWSTLLRSPIARATAAVLALGIGTAWVTAHPSPSIHSLAVLPASFGASPEPLVIDDITEELISRLSGLSSLTVLAYSTVQHYAKSALSPQYAGRELDVGAVLIWNARKEEDEIRVRVELVKTGSGALLWTHTYTTPTGSTLGIASAIATDIARQLHAPVTREAQQRLSRLATNDTGALRLYQRGRQAWAQRSEAGFREAIDYFQRAIKRDPSYPEAYAGIADCYITLGRQQLLPPDVAFPAARVAAQRALALDSTLAEAHASLAVVLNRYDWDRSGSAREFERAIQLSPSYATAWQWYGITLETQGRTEAALAASSRALELDPLSPMVRASYSDRHFFAGRYEEALRQIRYILEVSPDFAPGRLRLGLVLLEMHKVADAVAEFRRTIQLTDSASGLDKLGYSYAVLGRAADARAIAHRLNELSRIKWVSLVARAEIQSALGDTTAAFELLDEAVRRRDDELVMLHINPRLEPLRHTRHFQALLEKVKLPHHSRAAQLPQTGSTRRGDSAAP